MNQTENKSSTKSDMLQNGLDMIYLTVCALWDVTPQKKMMDKMKLSEVYRIAKYQSMAAVACYGLEKWLCSPEGMHQEIEAELLTKWKQTRDMAIRKNAMLDLSRESLFAYFEEQGIWYMPLKGSILKDMYPRLGMRQMADNDILIDVTYRKQIYDYMIAQGYEGVYSEYGAHDTFLKKPFYNFEMHNTLFTSSLNPLWQEYYHDIFWGILEKVYLKEEIEKLPNGLDTVLGKDNMSLSGGQNQRLCIARLMFRNPKIIIMKLPALWILNLKA